MVAVYAMMQQSIARRAAQQDGIFLCTNRAGEVIAAFVKVVFFRAGAVCFCCCYRGLLHHFTDQHNLPQVVIAVFDHAFDIPQVSPVLRFHKGAVQNAVFQAGHSLRKEFRMLQ